MNHQRKIKAIEKFSEQIKANVEGAKLALKDFNKDKPYTDAEIKEVIDTVLNPATPEVKKINVNSNTGGSGYGNLNTSQVMRPNDAIQEALKDIDYNKLIPVQDNEGATAEAAANLAKYNAIVGTLFDTQQYDFTQYKAAPTLKKILNDQADKITVMTGIRLVSQTPINHSRMQLWAAKDLNSQISNPNNPPTNSRYYFLTKY